MTNTPKPTEPQQKRSYARKTEKPNDFNAKTPDQGIAQGVGNCSPSVNPLESLQKILDDPKTVNRDRIAAARAMVAIEKGEKAGVGGRLGRMSRDDLQAEIQSLRAQLAG